MDVGRVPVKLRWKLDAACRGHDTIDFFPTTGDIEGMNKAKAVCEGCPVKHECLKFALDGGYGGVWGGTSERERLRHGRRLLFVKEAVATSESVR